MSYGYIRIIDNAESLSYIRIFDNAECLTVTLEYLTMLSVLKFH